MVDVCSFAATVPDPQDIETFKRSQLNPQEVGSQRCQEVLGVFKATAAMRRFPQLFGATTDPVRVQLDETGQTLTVSLSGGLLMVANFAQVPRTVAVDSDLLRSRPWQDAQLLLTTSGYHIHPEDSSRSGSLTLAGCSLAVFNVGPHTVPLSPHQVPTKRIVHQSAAKVSQPQPYSGKRVVFVRSANPAAVAPVARV